MKFTYRCFLAALVAGVVLFPALQALAQDTLVVDYKNLDGTVKINALLNAVLGDTIPGGARANLNRVYKLMKGGYYENEERIENGGSGGWPLRIVGEAAGATELDNPPVLQMVRRQDGTVDQRMITGQHDVTLKNLWITGADDTGVQTAYQPIQIDASNHTFIIDNCIFDRSNFAITAFTATGNKITFTNNKFRNLIGRPSTQQWEGRGISVWADQDTVIVENNTFFNVNFTCFQMESGAAKYVRFNHNTIVNNGRNFIQGAWWRDAYFANNLIINGFWMGEGLADYSASGRDPRAYNSGMFAVGQLPASYGPEQGRRILLANTAAWRDPQFATLYGDTIRPQFYVNRVTTEDFLDVYTENMVMKDTMWLGTRPNFPTYPDTLIPKMWANITDLRRSVTPATEYFYTLPYFAGTECFTCVSWPLPEDFSYTSPANLLTAGTDHLPLGDLNWFPAQKAIFEANKELYLDTLEALAGPVTVFTPVAGLEAEDGTAGNGAALDAFAGFSYFHMNGGGTITWTFDIATAGQYDLRFWVNEYGRGMSGPEIHINGTPVHDVAHGWGQFIFDVALGPAAGLPNNEWIWVNVAQDSLLTTEAGVLTWAAGTNTLMIKNSWGEMGFAGIDVIRHGTTDTLKLRAPQADYTIVEALGEGAPWVPSRFKSVLMGTNGTVTWAGVDAPTTGDYTVSLFYQNFGSAQTASIQLDGATVLASVALPSIADSTGLSVLATPAFPVTAGTHTLGVTASGVNLDWVQFTKVDRTTDVLDPDGVPGSFALDQNYPNPFNPTTTINFALAKASNVELTVYNVLGQRIATLVNGQLAAGTHNVKFNARNFASGVYFYRLDAGGFVALKKMMLLK
jgi:hypothetical protein